MPVPGQVPPQQAQKTVKAKIHLVTFVSKPSPSKKDAAEFDKEVSDFLATIDNKKRFLNGRNAYAIGNRTCVQVWYLQSIEPEVKPLGKKNDSTEKPIIKT